METFSKTLIAAHIHMLHAQLPPFSEDDVQVVKGGTCGAGVHVLAAKAMNARTLFMAPLATGGTCLSRLSSKADQPYTLTIHVKNGRTQTEWFLNGASGLPAASAAAEAEDNIVSQHNWMTGHHGCPLWWMKRVSNAADANCILEDMDVRMVTTFAPPEPLEAFADNIDVRIPVLVNTSSLSVGDELQVLWAPRAKVLKKKTKIDIWTEHARTKLGQQMRPT